VDSLTTNFRVSHLSQNLKANRVTPLSVGMPPAGVTSGGSLHAIPVRSIPDGNRVRLETPIGESPALHDWWKEVCDSSKPLAKRVLEIHQLDESGHPTKGWRLNGCWPCKFGISPIRWDVSEPIREHYELVFEWVEEISFGLTSSSGASQKAGPHSQKRPFKTYQMDEFFSGEDLPESSWIGSQVQYLTSEERQKYQLFVHKGKLVDSSGIPFDTSTATTLWSDQGAAICVMDEEGNLFAARDQIQGEFHHSSFLSGGPVAFAGEVVVDDGRLIAVSNKSGHYRPPGSSIEQLKTQLDMHGLDTANVTSEVWIES